MRFIGYSLAHVIASYIVGFMKTNKILQELNSCFDEASRLISKRNKTRNAFLKEIKVAETGLLKQLKKESQKSRKKKLKHKLSLVKSAHTSLL